MLTPLFSLSCIPMYMHIHVYIIYIIYIYIYLFSGISHCTLVTTRIVAHAPAQMKCSHSLLFNQGPHHSETILHQRRFFLLNMFNIHKLHIMVRFNRWIRWILHPFWPNLWARAHPLPKTPTTYPCSTWNSPGRLQRWLCWWRRCHGNTPWPQRINKWYPEVTKKPYKMQRWKKTSKNTSGVEKLSFFPWKI